MLATEEFRCRGLIEKFGVKVICTTDDPVDDLADHTKIAQDPTCKFKVYPAWRPDKVLNIDRGGFIDYMNRLSPRFRHPLPESGEHDAGTRKPSGLLPCAWRASG